MNTNMPHDPGFNKAAPETPEVPETGWYAAQNHRCLLKSDQAYRQLFRLPNRQPYLRSAA